MMDPFDSFEEEQEKEVRPSSNRGVIIAIAIGGVAIVSFLIGCIALLTFIGPAVEGVFNEVSETLEETGTTAETSSETAAETTSGETDSGNVFDAAENLLLASNLPGLYNVEGTNPNGGTYQGTLEITQPGEFFAVEWVINDEVITGTGLLQDNVFSVSWGGRLCVAQYYKVYEDGSLDGVWFWIRNPEQLGTEYVEPLADGSENLLVGIHDMTGVNPDGGEYSGTAEISVSGSVYSITWVVGDDTLPATGVRQGDVISVGWGEESCSVASYIVNGDGTLSGIWTNVGEALLGTETGEKVNEQ